MHVILEASKVYEALYHQPPGHNNWSVAELSEVRDFLKRAGDDLKYDLAAARYDTFEEVLANLKTFPFPLYIQEIKK